VRIARAILLSLVLGAQIAPLVASLFGLDPYAMDAGAVYAPPSFHHPLGTDDLGRDVLARLLTGARISISVAVIGTIASMSAGCALGFVSGYFGGLVDRALLRIVEAMSALPKLPLMLILASMDLSRIGVASGGGASIIKLTLVIVLFGWMSSARLSRTLALQIRETEYVLAARALGASDRAIITRHILPNAASPLLVAGALELADLVLYESAISFLGLGVQPPIPSLGALLANGMTYLYDAPLLLVLPGVLTLAIVAAFQIAADLLRDRLDPRAIG
jgi:peptide/nickel transport system permease protein